MARVKHPEVLADREIQVVNCVMSERSHDSKTHQSLRHQLELKD